MPAASDETMPDVAPAQDAVTSDAPPIAKDSTGGTPAAASKSPGGSDKQEVELMDRLRAFVESKGAAAL